VDSYLRGNAIKSGAWDDRSQISIFQSEFGFWKKRSKAENQFIGCWKSQLGGDSGFGGILFDFCSGN